jgi:hypothetical protein
MNEDMLVTFRTLSGEWADQARVEAKAAIEAFNAGAGDATERRAVWFSWLIRSTRIAPARSMAYARR